jgi:hypothetical protein
MGAFHKLGENYKNKGDAQIARIMYFEQMREMKKRYKLNILYFIIVKISQHQIPSPEKNKKIKTKPDRDQTDQWGRPRTGCVDILRLTTTGPG